MADELIPLEAPFQGRVRSEADLKGAPGNDGRAVELQKSATHVQWRYVGDFEWIDLIPLAEIAGSDGVDGTNGTDGTNGNDGEEVALQATTTHIQWRLGDGVWQDLVALADLKGDAGNDGSDGREIELTKSATHIQWRYVGETTWLDLVALSALEGAAGNDGIDGNDGPAIELQTSATHIQWRVMGDAAWIDLIALSELKGDPGQDAVLPANNVTGTGITHIAAVTEYPATEVNGTLYVLLPEVPA